MPAFSAHVAAGSAAVPVCLHPRLFVASGFGDACRGSQCSPGGVIAVMVDGSAHFVEESIDPMVWKNLGTRKGGISAELPAD